MYSSSLALLLVAQLGLRGAGPSPLMLAPPTLVSLDAVVSVLAGFLFGLEFELIVDDVLGEVHLDEFVDDEGLQGVHQGGVLVLFGHVELVEHLQDHPYELLGPILQPLNRLQRRLQGSIIHFLIQHSFGGLVELLELVCFGFVFLEGDLLLEVLGVVEGVLLVVLLDPLELPVELLLLVLPHLFYSRQLLIQLLVPLLALIELLHVVIVLVEALALHGGHVADAGLVGVLEALLEPVPAPFLLQRLALLGQHRLVRLALSLERRLRILGLPVGDLLLV
eukprot:CAMPEP_0170547048 /NCGR_PEP_ID=MMETSP0211-20121228/5401_1 /TAXON_ID=311385 /ORGANISM="Pseudokeronopsis sp., Strain OXSARD2" /LENGTH=278 /DNA_ID=CAMNT_0010851835 /DNA_START=906 /DNA_END=1741 /DNA_ORIENTATION=+